MQPSQGLAAANGQREPPPTLGFFVPCGIVRHTPCNMLSTVFNPEASASGKPSSSDGGLGIELRRCAGLEVFDE